MGLQCLLKICEKYANTHSITFNVTKSKSITFFSHKCKFRKPVDVILGGSPIKWHQNVEHLGQKLNSNLNDKDDIRAKCVDFICKANYILSTFRFVNRNVLITLFKLHCSSFYGAILWNFNHSNMNDINVRWKHALRKIYNVPRHSRSNIMYKLSNTIAPEYIIHSRFIKFYLNSLASSNKLISFMSHVGLHTSQTLSGINRFFIERVYDINMSRCNQRDISRLQRKVIENFKNNLIYDENQYNIVCELLEARDGSSVVDSFTQKELGNILDEVITSRN